MALRDNEALKELKEKLIIKGKTNLEIVEEENKEVKLKDDKDVRKTVSSTIGNIMSQLDYIESSEAALMSEWLYKKAKYYNSHHNKGGYGRSPKAIKRWDIVRVELGYNVGDELSDGDRKCHFVLVIARKGYIFLGIPLTKTSQDDNEFAVNLGKIEELPEDTDTWAKIEAMRHLSIRRVLWMEQCKEGKLVLDENKERDKEIIKKIKEKILDSLINS